MSETIIDLPENLTIHQIEARYSDLKVSFLSDADNIKLNASQVETIDTSGLQALLILIKAAVSSGKKIHWEEPSEVLKVSAQQIGLYEKLQLV